MSNNSGIPGAYGPFTSDIDAQAKVAFAEAMEHFFGVKYSPVAVASQVVNGTNYAYFCNASPAMPNSPTYPAMVSIYKPLDGSACLTHIERLPY